MQLWKHGFTLALAGVLCGWAATSAQEKKPPVKKAVKEPPVEKAPRELPPPAVTVEAAPVPGQAPVGAIPSFDYNYYHPAPGSTAPPQIPAQLYLCPSPYPPPYVGYTYITYPPFQPHEWLWIHRRASTVSIRAAA